MRDINLAKRQQRWKSPVSSGPLPTRLPLPSLCCTLPSMTQVFPAAGRVDVVTGLGAGEGHGSSCILVAWLMSGGGRRGDKYATVNVCVWWTKRDGELRGEGMCVYLSVNKVQGTEFRVSRTD